MDPVAALNHDIVIPVDLESLDVGDKFFVTTELKAAANVWEGAREQWAGAFLRDPSGTGGTTMSARGLRVIDEPVPAPMPCATQPDPAAGTLQFDALTYQLLEQPIAGLSGVTVTRSNGATGAVSALLTARGGTAQPGVDYVPLATAVHFGDGDATPRVIPIDILLNPAETSPDPTLSLVLEPLGGCAAIGEPSTAVATIVDTGGPVAPPEAHTVGGTVEGLIGTGLVLQNHYGLFLEITGNGPFTFEDLPTPSGERYEVSVFNQPRNPSQHCNVINGEGVIGTADVTDIQVECVAP